MLFINLSIPHAHGVVFVWCLITIFSARKRCSGGPPCTTKKVCALWRVFLGRVADLLKADSPGSGIDSETNRMLRGDFLPPWCFFFLYYITAGVFCVQFKPSLLRSAVGFFSFALALCHTAVFLVTKDGGGEGGARGARCWLVAGGGLSRLARGWGERRNRYYTPEEFVLSSKAFVWRREGIFFSGSVVFEKCCRFSV